MKFKKGDLVYYTRSVGADRHTLTRGILTALVLDAYKTRSGKSREYKMLTLHDETTAVQRGHVFYCNKAQEKHYRLEK